MKITRKIIIFAIITALVASLAVTAFAAVPTAAGGTATVIFTVSGIYGIDGFFEFSNRALFSGVSYRNLSAISGDVSNDKVYLYGFSLTDVNIELTLVVSESAQEGDECVITFNYETSDENGHMTDWTEVSQTVYVVKTEESSDDPGDSSETPSEDNHESKPPVQKPTVDYTEIDRQLRIARGLNESDYTASSWEAFTEAFNNAENARRSGNQANVDAAARKLAEAIAALVKIDYTRILAAASEARRLVDVCAHSDLWYKLFDLLEHVDEIIATRDQDKIDAYAAEIENAIAAIREDCPDCGKTTEVSVVEREVIREIEVDPPEGYCNVPSHKVWPVLFFVSLSVNLVLGGLIAAFFLKRKKAQKDDTPLVDYDIEDDD